MFVEILTSFFVAAAALRCCTKGKEVNVCFPKKINNQTTALTHTAEQSSQTEKERQVGTETIARESVCACVCACVCVCEGEVNGGDTGSGTGEREKARERCGGTEWGMGEKREGQCGGWGREILLCAAGVTGLPW